MLNTFKSTTLNAFKTAYIHTSTGEKIPFKYRLMTDKEVEEMQFMRGLESGRTTMSIATNDTIEVDTKSRLIIDGFYYSIITITGKLTDSQNGMFRKVGEKTLYMAVQR